METTKFSDLHNHEKLAAIGQMAIQAGMFIVALATVFKHLGNLPERPIFPAEPAPQQPNNSRGYFN